MEQVSFNFMAADTIHSDFGAQENKLYSVTVSIILSSICCEAMGLDALILFFKCFKNVLSVLNEF